MYTKKEEEKRKTAGQSFSSLLEHLGRMFALFFYPSSSSSICPQPPPSRSIFNIANTELLATFDPYSLDGVSYPRCCLHVGDYRCSDW